MFSHLKGDGASESGDDIFDASARKTDVVSIASEDVIDSSGATTPSEIVPSSSDYEASATGDHASSAGDSNGPDSPVSASGKPLESIPSETSYLPAVDSQAPARLSEEEASRSGASSQPDAGHGFVAYSPAEIEISDPIVVEPFDDVSADFSPAAPAESASLQGAVDSNNQVRERIKFLFVPTACSSFDSGKLARALKNYAELFDIDLIVVTGDRRRILPIINEFDQNKYATTMNMQHGLVICKQDFTTRSNPGYVEFRNFAVQLYQGEITGDRFDPNASASASGAYLTRTFEKLGSVRKPSLVFASPLETSYYDTVVMPGDEFDASDSLGNGTFVQDFESWGYVDAYNAVRYSAPTIGTAHPGFTYSDESGNFRIDFVLFKDMIPSFADTLYLSGVSDLENVRRYAVIGEMAL